MINALVKLFLKDRLKDIETFSDKPIKTQSNILHSLLHSAKDTQFGQKYGFESINNSKVYKERVPLHHYEDLKPYIERIFKGEDNVIWPSPIRWFAKSSGTTSDKSKFIPVSYESLEDNHYKAGKDLMANYCNNHPETGLFKSGNNGGRRAHPGNPRKRTKLKNLNFPLKQLGKNWGNWHFRGPEIEEHLPISNF